MIKKFKIMPVLTGTCALIVMSGMFIPEGQAVECKALVAACAALAPEGKGCEGFVALAGAMESCLYNNTTSTGGQPKDKAECQSELQKMVNHRRFRCVGEIFEQ